KVTSLGVELATNPDAFGTLGENAILALSNLTHFGTQGFATASETISGAGWDAASARGSVLGVGTDIYVLIDFLIKTTEARILNQQTVWTKDNEEARFFKGQVVAFTGGSTITGSGASQQSIEYRPIGMEVAARPSITPEDSVDMIVGVELSALLADIVNNQRVQDKMKTTTNMIVQDGQTLMLGGILFQKDSTIEAKLPLLGDLPLIGGLFRHTRVDRSNRELLVFITPHVVDEGAVEIPENVAPVEKLQKTREQLEATAPTLDLNKEEE
ncbi:MAG: hypothetical protein AMJ65_14455, partial [Phycisphaerae bacterium SG8_4]